MERRQRTNDEQYSAKKEEREANQDRTKEPNRARAAQQLWYPSQAWYRGTVVVGDPAPEKFQEKRR
jgi:hypothetical protein